MGAFTSVHNQMSDAEEETPPNPECTPHPTFKHKKRILNIDPRSPSENILRTPIVVDRTPSQSQTPKSDATISSSLKDPRSPTTDFTRTPLTLNLMNSHRQCEKDSMPVRAQSMMDTPVSHYSLTSESGIESADVTPVSKGENIYLSSPDSAVNTEPTYPAVSDDSLSASECSGNTGLDDQPSPLAPKCCDASPLLDQDLQGMHISQDNEATPLVRIENTPASYLKLRHVPLGKKTGSISMDSKTFRSPLSFVDNSPRYGKLSKQPLRPSSSNTDQRVDKENICH